MAVFHIYRTEEDGQREFEGEIKGTEDAAQKKIARLNKTFPQKKYSFELFGDADPLAEPKPAKAKKEPKPKAVRAVRTPVEVVLKPCLCGCGAMVRSKFRQGHDATVKSRLLKYGVWLAENKPEIDSGQVKLEDYPEAAGIVAFDNDPHWSKYIDMAYEREWTALSRQAEAELERVANLEQTQIKREATREKNKAERAAVREARKVRPNPPVPDETEEPPVFEEVPQEALDRQERELATV